MNSVGAESPYPIGSGRPRDPHESYTEVFSQGDKITVNYFEFIDCGRHFSFSVLHPIALLFV